MVKKTTRSLKPKPYNDGTLTEAAFRSWIRSGLRKLSLRWRPIGAVLREGRREATWAEKEKWGGKITWVYPCAKCGEWFPQKLKGRKLICVDHIIPCGSLQNIKRDAGPFILRLLVERNGLQRLCVDRCHAEKTLREREANESA